MSDCVKCGSQKAYWMIRDKKNNTEYYCDPCFKKYDLAEYKKEMDEYHKRKKEESSSQFIFEQAGLCKDININGEGMDYREVEKVQQRIENEETTINELPKNLSWKKSTVSGEKFSFPCSNCKAKSNLQIKQLSSQASDSIENLTFTGRQILWGVTAWGKILAFLTAMTLGIFWILITRKYYKTTSIGIILIYFILKPFFVNLFIERLPVYTFKCIDCGHNTFIASDGATACIGYT